MSVNSKNNHHNEEKTSYSAQEMFERGEKLLYINGKEQNYTEAKKYFLQAAKAGSSDAMWQLGNMYENGLGCEENKEHAVKWYSKSAENGSIEGMDQLATIYKSGLLGIEKDGQKAVEWKIKQAKTEEEAGKYYDACKTMWNIGTYYSVGDIIKQNHHEAIKWLKKASVKSVTAVEDLIEYYREGRHIKKNYKKLIELHVKKIELLNEASIENIEIENTLWTIIRLEDTYIAYETKKKLEEDFNCYTKATKKKDPQAMFRLGKMYELGQHVEKDTKKAFELFMDAAKLENIDAMNYVSSIYQLGLCGMDIDKTKVAQWKLRAALAGDSLSMYEMGCYYEDGSYCEQSYDKALEWYEKAALELKYAFLKVMSYYEKGIHGKKDMKKLANWCEIGVELYQSKVAMKKLVEIYKEGLIDNNTDYKKALFWYKKLAERTNHNLAKRLEEKFGNNLDIIDYKKAVEWYEKEILRYKSNLLINRFRKK